jgi:predicted nucleotidyltransferase
MFQDLITVDGLARQNGLRYLVAGGVAVNFHGNSRSTVDLDLAIPEDSKQTWRNILDAQGWKFRYSDKTSMRYQTTEGEGALPVDFLPLDSATFEKLWAGAQGKEFRGTLVPYVSVYHLLAMKLFACQNEARRAKMKDLPDIIALFNLAGYHWETSEWQMLLERFANAETKGFLEQQLKS